MLYLRIGYNLHNITGFSFYFRFYREKVLVEISKSFELDARVFSAHEKFVLELDLFESEIELLSLQLENYIEGEVKVLDFTQITEAIKFMRNI